MDRLFSALSEGIAEWPREKLERHGFGLLPICDRDEQHLHGDRRAQARVALKSRHIVKQAATVKIPFIVMKGVEVAALYRSPTHRPHRDVDLLTSSPSQLWLGLRQLGYQPSPRDLLDPAHHHLPGLKDHTGLGAIEVHSRPNLPAWASIDIELLFDSAVPSRTGIDGALRPRDDLHALIMVLHGWKGGFTRLRDLFDALLLAAVSERDVYETSRELGLAKVWDWSVRLADFALFGATPSRFDARAFNRLLGHTATIKQRTATRILSSYLVVDPVKATKSHVQEYRMGRRARLSSPEERSALLQRLEEIP